MENNFYTKDVSQEEVGFSRFLVKVFGFMFIALLLTLGVVSVINSSVQAQEIVFSILSVKAIGLIMLFVFLGISMTMSKALSTGNIALGLPMFILYIVFTGAILSPIPVIYTYESILYALLGASMFFIVLSIFGYFTGFNLGSLGTILRVGIITVILSSILNIFVFKSQGMDNIISVITIIIFAAYTAYDIQKLKVTYNKHMDSKSQLSLALLGALSLYVDFINLFIRLLSLFGNRRSRD